MLIDTFLRRENIAHETDKAILFAIPHTADRKVWLPKSQIEWTAVGCYAETAHIPAWLARKSF